MLNKKENNVNKQFPIILIFTIPPLKRIKTDIAYGLRQPKISLFEKFFKKYFARKQFYIFVL